MRGGGGMRGGGSRRPVRIRLDLRSDTPIDYKNQDLIKKCVGAQGQIMSRRRTGLSASQQRELKTAIKRARHLALLPFVG